MRYLRSWVTLALVGLGAPALAAPDPGQAAFEGLKASWHIKSRNPALWGLDTKGPHVAFYVPDPAWDQLKPADQEALKAWMPMLVKKTRADAKGQLAAYKPLPDFAKYQAGFARLKPSSWALVGVKDSGSGRSFTVTRILACGDGDCQ